MISDNKLTSGMLFVRVYKISLHWNNNNIVELMPLGVVLYISWLMLFVNHILY